MCQCFVDQEPYIHHSRQKHIDICHHAVRDWVADGRIDVKYVPSKDQLADALTKPLPKDANMRIATLLLGQDFLAVQRIVEKLAGDIPVVQNINYASLHCGGV